MVLSKKTFHGDPPDQLTHSRFIRALRRQPVDRVPLWFMRQAGRYLPEYQKVRASAGDFLTLCKTPELACQVTLQPLERFPLDAAIIFSDILTIPDAMGLGLQFSEGHGPYFEKPINTEEDVLQLSSPDPEKELQYVMDAIRLTRKALNPKIPLIGFSGSPWTLATYMIEGGSTKEFRRIKNWLYQNPELLHRLLAHLTNSVSEYLHAQIKAGASVVMIFDTWGGLLAKKAYLEFSLYYMNQIVSTLQQSCQVPIILFTKNGGLYLSEIADSGCDAIGLDWQADLTLARNEIGDRTALQGNLDPMALHAPEDRLREEVIQVLEAFGHGSGHIFNLGHGILPDTDPEKLGFVVQTVQEISPLYHMENG